MEPFTITMSLERETKNTYRYAEESANGQPPKIKTLYIPKWATGQYPPGHITVTIEAVEPED